MTGTAVTTALIKQRNVARRAVVAWQLHTALMRDDLLRCAQVNAALHMPQAGWAPEPLEDGVILLAPKAWFECPEDDSTVM